MPPIPVIAAPCFSGSNVVYLSDLVPTRSQWQPFFPAATLQQEFQRLFEPRMNENFDNEPLRLVMADGRRQEFTKGLALHSRSEVVYRMPLAFYQFCTHLLATIEIHLDQLNLLKLFHYLIYQTLTLDPLK